MASVFHLPLLLPPETLHGLTAVQAPAVTPVPASSEN